MSLFVIYAVLTFNYVAWGLTTNFKKGVSWFYVIFFALMTLILGYLYSFRAKNRFYIQAYWVLGLGILFLYFLAEIFRGAMGG